MNAKQLFIHALTPLHPGTGRGLGVVDLPVAREVATGLPYLPGSSVKGVLRDRCGGNGDCVKLFGPDTSNADAHAGAVQFTDMRLLLLPVRSLAGTFAWVTSPFALKRLQRDCRALGDSSSPKTVHNFKKDKEKAALTKFTKITILEPSGDKKFIILEDLKLDAIFAKNARLWAGWLKTRLFPDDKEWQALLDERFCIVHDDVFSFLLETATEIIARIKMEDDSKTVAKGGLWYEEALPAETILYGLVVAQQVGKNGLSPAVALNKIADLAQGEAIQFGGSATIGRGLCRLMMV